MLSEKNKVIDINLKHILKNLMIHIKYHHISLKDIHIVKDIHYIH